MTTINPGYGYRLLKEGEPVLLTDESRIFIPDDPRPRWVSPTAYLKTCPETATIRRKIDVGEGWELVPEDEKTIECDEYLESNGNWYPIDQFGKRPQDYKTVPTIRRRKNQIKDMSYGQPSNIVLEPKSAFQKWVRFEDMEPSCGDVIWICSAGFRPTVVEWHNAMSAGGNTHWMPATIPEPPKHEAASDEQAFQAWSAGNFYAGFAKDAWHAALKWERERKKE